MKKKSVLYSDGFDSVNSLSMKPVVVAPDAPQLYDTVSAVAGAIGQTATAAADITKAIEAEKTAQDQNAGKKTDLTNTILSGKETAKSAQAAANAQIAAAQAGVQTTASTQKTIIIVSIVFVVFGAIALYAWSDVSEDKIAAEFQVAK